MKKVLLAAMALMALTASAKVNAGDEPKVEEKRSLKGFERIEQKGSLDVKYQQGTVFSVVVKAPKSVLKRVDTRVEGNKLVIGMKGSNKIFNFSSAKGDDVTVYVVSPDLIGVELNGSGNFECKKHLDTDSLDLSLKGSGDMEFTDIICDRIKVSLVGSGEMDIKKVITQQSAVSLIGSGDVKVSQQRAKQTKIELKGSGDVKVNFQNCGSVESHLLGSGDITLTGDVTSHKYYKRASGDYDTEHLTIKK